MTSAFFGGSFDPPHLGHLAVARGALASGRCDLVRFVVGVRPPHKAGVKQSSFADRLAMTEALISGEKAMEVSDLETHLPAGKPTYTIEALELYREVYGERPILLVGADSLLQLHSWKAAEKLVDEYEIVTYPRPGCEVTLAKLREHWDAERAEKLLSGVLPGELFAVSSSELKAAAFDDRTYEQETEAVREYIRDHRLYEEDKMTKATHALDQQLIDVCRRAIAEKSGENIVLLTPGAASSVADFYVISSAESEPQLRAMASQVERQIREELKLRPLSAPSDSSTGWVLLDYGNVLVHLMTAEIREKYDLEGLWGNHPEDPELIGKLQKRKTATR